MNNKNRCQDEEAQLLREPFVLRGKDPQALAAAGSRSPNHRRNGSKKTLGTLREQRASSPAACRDIGLHENLYDAYGVCI